MNRNLPPPTAGLFRRETRIVVPPLIEKFLGSVRQTAPRECRDRIDDFSQSAFRLLDLHEPMPGPIGKGVMVRAHPSGTRRPAAGQSCSPFGSISRIDEMISGA